MSEVPALGKNTARRDQYFTVMITPKEGDTVMDVKKDLRQLWKDVEDVSTPVDVMSKRQVSLF